MLAQKHSLFLRCFPKLAASLDKVRAKEWSILPGGNLFALSPPRCPCLPHISVCPTLISCTNAYNAPGLSPTLFSPKDYYRIEVTASLLSCCTVTGRSLLPNRFLRANFSFAARPRLRKTAPDAISLRGEIKRNTPRVSQAYPSTGRDQKRNPPLQTSR